MQGNILILVTLVTCKISIVQDRPDIQLQLVAIHIFIGLTITLCYQLWIKKLMKSQLTQDQWLWLLFEDPLKSRVCCLRHSVTTKQKHHSITTDVNKRWQILQILEQQTQAYTLTVLKSESVVELSPSNLIRIYTRPSKSVFDENTYVTCYVATEREFLGK